jgi:ABC-type transport system substrate-binding protein
MKKYLILLGFVVVSAVLVINRFNSDIVGLKTDLNVVINNDIKSFDPAIAFNDDSLKVISQSLETLYQYHYLKRPYEVIPLLADGKPKITNGGLTYTIKIKKNIFYHFGNKESVKAQHFVNQIKRLSFKPIHSTGKWLFEGKIKGLDLFSKSVGNDFQKMLDYEVEGLKAIDDYTLEINLIKPEPNMLYFLCMPFTSPVSKSTLVKHNNDLSAVINGTGAYVYTGTDSGEISFQKYKKYRNEYYPSSGDRYANTEDLLNSSTQKLPFINTIKFHIIAEENDQWEALKKGEIDILSVPKSKLASLTDDNSQINELIRNKKVQLKHFSKLSSRWLGFNMKDSLWGKNRYLREAIAHAIDFDEYIQIMSNNTNLRANSLINPSIPGYRPSHKMSYNYDLDKANSLIKKSGVSKSKLKIKYSTRGRREIHLVEARFVKKSLEKIGIEVEVDYLDFSTFLREGRAGNLQFFTDSWIFDYPDSENLLQLLISKNIPGINKSAYVNKRVDLLYEKLARTLSPEQRFEIIQDIESIVDKELPWIPLMFESSYILYSTSIKNFRKSFFIRNHYKYLKTI